MKNILIKKYEKIKKLIKEKSGNNKDKIIEEKILLYTTILSYYSAKLDLKMSDNRLIDKILLNKYDKILVDTMNLNEVLDSFVNSRNENKRASFYDTIHFLELTIQIVPEMLREIKDEYDAGYLATVLNYNQGILTNHENKIIDKKNKKIQKILCKYDKL